MFYCWIKYTKVFSDVHTFQVVAALQSIKTSVSLIKTSVSLIKTSVSLIKTSVSLIKTSVSLVMVIKLALTIV